MNHIDGAVERDARQSSRQCHLRVARASRTFLDHVQLSVGQRRSSRKLMRRTVLTFLLGTLAANANVVFCFIRVTLVHVIHFNFEETHVFAFIAVEASVVTETAYSVEIVFQGLQVSFCSGGVIEFPLYVGAEVVHAWVGGYTIASVPEDRAVSELSQLRVSSIAFAEVALIQAEVRPRPIVFELCVGSEQADV